MALEATKQKIRWGVFLAVATGIALGAVLSERIEERIAERTGERATHRTVSGSNPYGDCVNGVSDYLGDLYFNSCEPGCGAAGTALNPNFLMCDDREDGTYMMGYGQTAKGWFVQYGDVTDSYADPPNYYDFGRCGAAGYGAAGTECSGTSGGVNDVGMNNDPCYTGTATAGVAGRHYFAPDGNTEVDEIYARWYQRELDSPHVPGFRRANEKIMFFENNSLDPKYQAGALIKPTSEPFVRRWSMYVQMGQSSPSTGGSAYLVQNQGNDIYIEPPNWHYVEVYIKLNTVGCTYGVDCDGVHRMWIDDCGADGRQCLAPGTLRAEYTDVHWRYTAQQTIKNIWRQSYCNSPGCCGEQEYDQLVLSRTRIGPMTPVN